MGYILITNDDGVDSPALGPLMRALRVLARIRVVVPQKERSWISKAITRFDRLRIERIERDGCEITVVHGFPADCTNLAVHSLFGERPELVVAGVNIGLNSGLGFFLSSGTVGAAAEAWIAGIPAVAFSVGVQGSDRDWKKRALRGEMKGIWERAAALAADIVRSLLADGFPGGADLLNVNFPVEAGPETRRAVTRIAAAGYDRLFRPAGDGVYVHDYAGELRLFEDLAGTDIDAVRRGWVSITPVRLAQTAQIAPEVCARLESSAR